jgi:hypothetical protein
MDHARSPYCHASSPTALRTGRLDGRTHKSSSDGSPRRGKDAVQEFPHRHACVSSALIPTFGAAAGRRHRKQPDDSHYDRPIAITHPPPTRSGLDDAPDRPAGSGAPDRPIELPDRIGSLRGASAQFDRRRAGQVVVGLVLATLIVLVAVLTVAGVHSNNQTDTLHQQGVPVTVRVTGCLGLLGGSGSNAAGYSCRGSYVLDGHRYAEPLPGTSFHRPGTRIPSLAVPGDPALVSPDSVIDTQHSSSNVFIVPAVLTGVLAVLLGLLLWQRQKTRRADRYVGGV